jgi:hypothetical protein
MSSARVELLRDSGDGGTRTLLFLYVVSHSLGRGIDSYGKLDRLFRRRDEAEKKAQCW